MKYKALGIGVLVLGLASVTPAMAALSGFYDSAEQITALLDSDAVAEALGQRPIAHMAHEGANPEGQEIWTLSVEGCEIEVYLDAIPPIGVGKTTYAVSHLSPCHDAPDPA